ncbi:hypothetical protein CCYA_CCYA09G2541 [Cyanidiococcus yangmingshanensis]|nr:hypothetical protein CCYA_CCYA09G2541 [Cyanidiococcus yangmingshanensis]
MVFMKKGYYAWRHHPLLQPKYNYLGAFPGIGAASVIFLGYLGLEKLWERADSSFLRYPERAMTAYREGYAQGLRERVGARVED